MFDYRFNGRFNSNGRFNGRFNSRFSGRLAVLALLAGLTACSGDPPASSQPGIEADVLAQVRQTEHRGGDDLVSAGLGLEGLSSPTLEISEPIDPDPATLRRMAIHTAWRGLSALNPAGGVGGLIDQLPQVEGREFMAFRALPGRTSPARVLVQLPDTFDPQSACLLLAPASGSRGVYGAIPLVAPWALPRGCAVVYTDKGAGTDFHRYDDGSGVGLDGRRVAAEGAAVGLVAPDPGAGIPPGTLAMAHAHSGDHPEADWGQYVLDAARFGLAVLQAEVDPALTPERVRIIAAGLSNGAGAALRAAEQDETGLIDGVLALMPNITPPDTPHLYSLATSAALLQPCLLGDLDYTMSLVLGNPLLAAAGQQRCASLAQAGLIDAPEPAAARARLLELGFDESALGLAAVNVVLDLWRSVAVTYASAYLRSGPTGMPCGFAFSADSADPAQVSAWWATHSGIAPGGGIDIVDGLAEGRDPAFPGLQCLAALAEDSGRDGERLRSAIEATRASAELPDIPVLLVHGREDGLIPVVFTSRPYAEQARAHGARLAYWEVARGQHFDALLAAPAAAGRLVPMLPFGWAGLDHIEAVLNGERTIGGDRQIEARPAPAGEALTTNSSLAERQAD